MTEIDPKAAREVRAPHSGSEDLAAARDRSCASVRRDFTPRARSRRPRLVSSNQILVGPKDKDLISVARAFSLDLSGIEIIDVPHSQAAAETAVALVRSGKAELLMKGSLHTDELLSEVVKRDTGIRTGRRISHVFVMDVPGHPHTLFITDAAVNIAPDLTAKRDIMQVRSTFTSVSGSEPRGILSAVETVTF